jgi:hypothetical protein
MNCDISRCQRDDARLYAGGRRCDDHKPQAVPSTASVPALSIPMHVCPGCGTAEVEGRELCQACEISRLPRTSPKRNWPDLSHGNPGHWCILPEAGTEAS